MAGGWQDHRLAAYGGEHLARPFQQIGSAGEADIAAVLRGVEDELLALHDGVLGEEEAIEKAVTATRQYAKRQDTWFRNQLPNWTRADGEGNFVTEMLKYL